MRDPDARRRRVGVDRECATRVCVTCVRLGGIGPLVPQIRESLVTTCSVCAVDHSAGRLWHFCVCLSRLALIAGTMSEPREETTAPAAPGAGQAATATNGGGAEPPYVTLVLAVSSSC